MEVVDDEVGGLVSALDGGFGSCGFWGLGGLVIGDGVGFWPWIKLEERVYCTNLGG